MASVSLQNVHKHYGKVNAVRGISMDVKNGEFIAFLGPSGCGKSSTMRMIAGLEEITAGDICFDGGSVIRRKPSERNVAMAFETYALYPTLTVFENLAFPLRAAGWKGPEVDQRVREVAEIIHITDLFEFKPNRLSSGQSQAVGLARALIRKPNVFLLDEPISHLDTSQRFQMRMYIKRLHIDLGYTMILVTHDQEDAMALADRVAVMSDGLLNQIDTPRNIYEAPADLFVAGFIGNLPMNFIHGKLLCEDGQVHLLHDAGKLALPARFAHSDLPPSGEIVLGVRPYHLSIVADSQGEGDLAAEVFVVEPLGDMNVATVQAGSLRLQIVTPVSYKAPPHTPVRVAIDPSRVLLFDRHSGKAIAG